MQIIHNTKLLLQVSEAIRALCKEQTLRPETSIIDYQGWHLANHITSILKTQVTIYRYRSHAKPAKKGDASVTSTAHGTFPQDPTRLNAARIGTIDLIISVVTRTGAQQTAVVTRSIASAISAKLKQSGGGCRGVPAAGGLAPLLSRRPRKFPLKNISHSMGKTTRPHMIRVASATAEGYGCLPLSSRRLILQLCHMTSASSRLNRTYSVTLSLDALCDTSSRDSQVQVTMQLPRVTIELNGQQNRVPTIGGRKRRGCRGLSFMRTATKNAHGEFGMDSVLQ